MRVYYAEVSILSGTTPCIVLSVLQTRETPKLYIVESKRDILSTCTDIRIPKDSPNIFGAIDDAMAYIHEAVSKHINEMQTTIARLQEKEARLVLAYEEAKRTKAIEGAKA